MYNWPQQNQLPNVRHKLPHPHVRQNVTATIHESKLDNTELSISCHSTPVPSPVPKRQATHNIDHTSKLPSLKISDPVARSQQWENIDSCN